MHKQNYVAELKTLSFLLLMSVILNVLTIIPASTMWCSRSSVLISFFCIYIVQHFAVKMTSSHNHCNFLLPKCSDIFILETPPCSIEKVPLNGSKWCQDGAYEAKFGQFSRALLSTPVLLLRSLRSSSSLSS